MNTKIINRDFEKTLLSELIEMIEQNQYEISVHVNSKITLLFWQVGSRINNHHLNNKRAEYGKQIVVTLSRQLVKDFGRNFEEKNLRRMLQFAELFPDFKKVVTLSRHLSWSHFLALLPLKPNRARHFYSVKIAEE